MTRANYVSYFIEDKDKINDFIAKFSNEMYE